MPATSFKNKENPCLYEISPNKDHIIFHPSRAEYLRKHIIIPEAFCYWYLILYLQKHNPNTPDIAEKLQPLTERNLKDARFFRRNYLISHPEPRCIYYSALLTVENLSIDHFVPFSCVAHDQLRNLTPTTKYVNSARSDKLPVGEKYFDGFANHQYLAFQKNYGLSNYKLLEDYSILFRKFLSEIKACDPKEFSQVLKEQIMPLLQIASNNGFPRGFFYNQKQ